MKKIATKILSILVLTLLITVTTAAAAERVKVFELAQSGVIITFPMSAEEIAAEDAEKTGLDLTSKAHVTNPVERLYVFEMAESGQTISFPMRAEEIAAEDAEKAKSNVSVIKKYKAQERVIEFELAESGEVIEFPAPEIEAVADYTDDIIGIADKIEVEDSKN